jgi:energy-coupling factor transporter transmembrane protein EcfT
MPSINIVTQLIAFLVLAIALSWLTFNWLLIIAIALVLLNIFNKKTAFYKSILRLKWFFIVMFIIFAFNTPGEHVDSRFLRFSPTLEGLQAGAAQLLRIVIMLAAISLILASNTKQQLISGFYFICKPLQIFGLKIDRFAARLWLTLHYVEAQQENKTQANLFEHLSSMRDISPKIDSQQDSTISFEMPIFSLIDYLIITSLMIGFVYLLIRAFW